MVVLEITLTGMAPVIMIPLIFMALVYAYSKGSDNASLSSLVTTEISEYIVFIILFLVFYSFITSSLIIDILGYLEDTVYVKVRTDLSIPSSSPLYKSSYIEEKGTKTASQAILLSASKKAIDRVENILKDATLRQIRYLKETAAVSSITTEATFLSASSPPEKGTGDKISKKNYAASAQISIPSCKGYYSASVFFDSSSFLIGSALMAVKFQRLLIDLLSSDRAVSVILAIGFLLRSNPATRGMGAFFLALGLGLYVILPYSILIMNDLVYLYFHNPVTQTTLYNNFLNSAGIPIKNGISLSEISNTIGLLGSGRAIRTVMCSPPVTTSYLNFLGSESVMSRASVLSSFAFNTILSQALVLLTFVSIVGGIAKAFGAEISPYVIGRLTYYLRS